MRIASLAKSNTEILHALGCTGEIVASTSYDAKIAPGSQAVGSYVDIDIPKVIALRPDIAFTSTFLQEKYAEQLRAGGIEVVHFGPLSVDEIMDSIIDAGIAVNKADEGQKIVAEMKSEIAKISEHASGTFPNIYFEEWQRPPMASGNWVVQMIELAGAKGVLRQGERSREISLEELLELNPEKIVLSWCGVGLNADPKMVKNRNGWNALGAVAQNKIFVVDDSYFNTPSQNVAKGIGEIAKILRG